ncbi:hypothetical protein OF113_10170 [Ectopseudomonas chengduensis]|nr:hypothetical protein [Pseudomonas chengduensis]UZT80389.1 hypothetical protein OF113_10170 [Pseudomonas chengduensis]
MKVFFPLYLIEVYLVFTLFLYVFGPVYFESHNAVFFWALIFLYHVSFVLGYVLSVFLYRRPASVSRAEYSPFLFYISLFFAVIGVLLAYKNLMLTSGLFPTNIVEEVFRGAVDPRGVYSERMRLITAPSYAGGMRWLNVLSIFFAFFKLLFIFVFVFYWRNLGGVEKSISCLYSLLFLAPGVASGTNSVIFIFFIFLIFSVAVVLFLKRRRAFWLFSVFGCALFFIPISVFGYVMSRRGGGFDSIARVSPLGDISVVMETPALDSLIGFLSYSLVWLNYYLVQGYYGFSLVLNMDLNWTFGFGNSAFLQRQLLLLTGVDVSEDTFQARISDIWDESGQWHSFYGHFANDFGFVGLSCFLLFLGFFVSRVWLSVIYQNSFYGAALVPVIIIMFVFIPANNQVFGYIDTFSYFVFISLFWLLEGKSMRWEKGNV